MEYICYEKNFLKQVILRVDFISPLPNIDKQLNKKLLTEIKKTFPIQEPRTTFNVEVKVDLEKQTTKQGRREAVIEWNFWDMKRDVKLTITKGTIILIFEKYKSYENLKTCFSKIIKKMYQTYKENMPESQRLGLRYINNFNLTGDVYSYFKHIVTTGTKAIYKDYSNVISRSVQVAGFNFGDFYIKFQYGIPNPDHPAVIKNKEFILDLDAHCSGSLDENEMLIMVDKFQERIQTLFEKSISKKLRKLMRPIDEK